MPQSKSSRRPIDVEVEASYSWLSKSFAFIQKSQIKTWHAIFVVAFITGITFAFGMIVSLDIQTKSKAAELVLFTKVENPISLKKLNSLRKSSEGVKRFEFLKLQSFITPDTTKFTLPLFENKNFRVGIRKVEARDNGRYSFFGKVDGDEQSRFILVSNPQKNLLYGYIFTNGMNFQINPTSENGIYKISEVEFSKIFEDRPIEPELPESVEAIRKDTMKKIKEHLLPDDGSIIDMMVIYTQDAASVSDDIESYIQLAIDYTNQALSESGVNFQIRLVHTAEIQYVETGDGKRDLFNIMLGLEGLNIVHDLRDQYGADVVSLWVKKTDAESGGRAAQMHISGSWFSPFAYSTVEFSADSFDFYTLAHEFGHNLGSYHDWYNTPGFLPTRYAHGSISKINDWQNYLSIMSVTNYCADNRLSCTVVPFYSNPKLTFNGISLGVTDHDYQPSDDAVSKPADNVRLFNEVAYIVANFRKQVIEAPTTGDIVYSQSLVNDIELGNGNFILEKGERAKLIVRLESKNLQGARIDLRGIISTDDPYIQIINPEASFLENNGMFTNENSPFIIEASQELPKDYELKFHIEAVAEIENFGQRTFDDDFSFTGNPTFYTWSFLEGAFERATPDVYGKKMVWADKRNGNWDIYLYDLEIDSDQDGIPNYVELERPSPDPAEKQITASSADQTEPTITNDFIVWTDKRNGNNDIYLYDLLGEVEFQISQDSSDEKSVDVSGEQLVWESGGNIYLYNLDIDNDNIRDYQDNELPENYEPLTRLTESGLASSPRIDNQKVVYKDKRSGTNEIYFYDLDLQREFQLSSDTKSETYPQISGNRALWIHDTWNVYIYELTMDSDNDRIPNYQDDDRVLDTDPARMRLNPTSLNYPGNPWLGSDMVIWDQLMTIETNNEYDLALYDFSLDSDGDGRPNYLDPYNERKDDPALKIITSTKDVHEIRSQGSLPIVVFEDLSESILVGLLSEQ